MSKKLLPASDAEKLQSLIGEVLKDGDAADRREPQQEIDKSYRGWAFWNTHLPGWPDITWKEEQK